MLLAIELVIRLDAALRVGLTQRSPDLAISIREIHNFNKLRNRKVDWDLVLARRFLDNVYVRRQGWSCDQQRRSPGASSGSIPERSRSGLICQILPRQPKMQIDGLVRFASIIKWPRLEQIESSLRSKLDRASKTSLELSAFFSGALKTTSESAESCVSSTQPLCSMSNHLSTECDPSLVSVKLQGANAHTSGGWLSRSWLSGLVLPGETAAHLLISTLLENDGRALQELGDVAHLTGGFVLDGRTWWSKACIVGRVLAVAAGSSDCMGWVNVPSVVPIDEISKRVFDNGWVHVYAEEVHALREHSRIHDGESMASESSPLGVGQGQVQSTEFTIPVEHACVQPRLRSIVLDSVLLAQAQSVSRAQDRPRVHKAGTASVKFSWNSSTKDDDTSVVLHLRYNVHYISSQPCRLPFLDVRSPTRDGIEHASSDGQRGRSRPLSSHPLHQSFRFVHKELADLCVSVCPPTPSDMRDEVWVLDARGCADREVLARAWCAQVGCHALVARMGRSCLSCCVREARAIDIGIVIRIGGVTE